VKCEEKYYIVKKKMENFSEGFKARTKEFALRIIRFYQALPKTGEAKIIGNQMLRSGTSIAANYRAACRARSEKEFFSKICTVIEEADETQLWLELLLESSIVSNAEMNNLLKEAEEILKIMVSTRQKLKQKNK
jgi:four helix bundle protein